MEEVLNILETYSNKIDIIELLGQISFFGSASRNVNDTIGVTNKKHKTNCTEKSCIVTKLLKF